MTNQTRKKRPCRKPPTIGDKQHKLQIVSYYGQINHHKYWNCLCECGNKTLVLQGNFLSQSTKSCGCLRHETKSNGSHGESYTKLYGVWCAMLSRCKNKKSKSYKNYGGRGIKVCKRWETYELFRDDVKLAMIKHIEENNGNTSLDRINNDRDYSPENCRWATSKEQCRNKRGNQNITYNGKTQCISAWCEQLGLPYYVISQRIKKLNWSIKKSIETPVTN